MEARRTHLGILFGLILGVGLVGCGQSEAETSAADSEPTTTAEAPEQGAPPSGGFPTIPEDFTPPPVQRPADPGTGGWRPAEESRTDLVALGARIDATIRSSENAYAHSQVRLRLPGSGTLDSGVALIHIEDASRFRYDFYMPETQGRVNYVVADGTRKAAVVDGEVRPVGTARTELSDEEFDAWLYEIGRSAFESLETGGPAWEAFLAGLEARDDVWDVSVETRMRGSEGMEREVLRVYAVDADGSRELELLFDVEASVPVGAMKVEVLADGRERAMAWRCAWFEGGDHTDDIFRIPPSSTQN